MRHVLAIPLEEVRRHFEVNERQSLKVVAPVRLGAEMMARLRAKPEAPLAAGGDRWRHSMPDEPNLLCESREFGLPEGARGFTISFGNERAGQETHVHRRHAEIYFSEHPIEAEYRVEDGGRRGTVSLPEGGALVFGPGVVHRVRLGGLTIVIEAPAVEGDKFGDDE
jgi:hypothetical protein